MRFDMLGQSPPSGANEATSNVDLVMSVCLGVFTLTLKRLLSLRAPPFFRGLSRA